MKNKFLALVFIGISFLTLAQEQPIHIKTNESGKPFIYNKYEYPIIEADSLTIDIKHVMKSIKSSTLEEPDIQLMLRIIEMQPNESKQRNELHNIAKTYPVVNQLLMEEYYLGLEKKFGTKKLKKLLKKK